jgi:hypothetical protein
MGNNRIFRNEHFTLMLDSSKMHMLKCMKFVPQCVLKHAGQGHKNTHFLKKLYTVILLRQKHELHIAVQ